MDEQVITLTLYIRADAAAVWKALTDPEITQRYWGGTRIESDWRPGSTIVYRRHGVVTDEHTLVDIAPGQWLVQTFRPVFGEYAAEVPSRVRIDLVPGGEVTRLVLRHDGFQPGSKVFAACSVGWPLLLSSLKTLLETGRPLPDFTPGG